jgi:HK97 family phage portal protein
MSSLPLHVYRKKSGGAERVNGAMSDMLGKAANDEMTSFDFRNFLFGQVFSEGRGLAYIERNAAGNPVNLFPMAASATSVKMDRNLHKTYHYTVPGTNKTVVYDAENVIDIPFMLKSDQITHISPITKNAEAIGLSIGAMRYGAKVFNNGGLPPLIMEGAFKSQETAERASFDLTKSIAKAYKQGRQALAMPIGYTVKPLGFNPSEMQLVELQRWCVEQIARIYSLPPTFLQDLSHGTKSTAEQEDLHFVKHTLNRWINQVEQELNLKLIGRGRKATYIKFNVDGLLRGDYRTRMEGNAKAISTGQLTPNEARALDNREALTGGDELYIQGANMPLKTQKDAVAGSGTPKADNGSGGDPNE